MYIYIYVHILCTYIENHIESNVNLPLFFSIIELDNSLETVIERIYMLRPQSTKLKPHGIRKKIKLEKRQQTFYVKLIEEKKLIIEVQPNAYNP